ncbi:tetratricopeptide repeat protein [Aliiglaciecola sp. 2_MG-2023]|uniref:tetratricopeptide repeat protein n=1 Tax=Alteromonadaceae TaxID=72275 RepID=UPI0026E293AE|nr:MULTISPECIES: tetratricopeptide repeat protein [unclassified Aliiglaciecola]MDO6713223.1 tetratricopeptide repeat protein [Aliiglaciecola sp. 2_MG-2023]MDO6754339.1 tetratricopeptide repeat protein [Aliiglaciecola sp. 1_MG-2023]
MSVVNKMLQDLEERKAEPEYSADYRPSNEKKKTLASIYILIAILIVAFAIWLFKDNLFMQKSQSQDVVEIAAETEKNIQEQPLEKQDQQANVVHDAERLMDSTNPELQLGNQLEQLNQLDNEDVIEGQLQSTGNLQANVQVEDNELLQSANNAIVQRVEDDQQSTQIESVSIADVEQKLTKMKSASKPQESEKLENLDTVDGVFEMKSSDTAIDKEQLKQQVQIALKRGDDRTAINLLEKLVEVTPENTTARKRLASMLFAQGNHDKADKTLQKGIDLYPGNLELRIMQARLYDQLKKPVQGFELLMAHTVSAFQAPDYVAYRATLAQKANKFEQAKLDYQQLAKSQSANAKWWLGLAVVEERLGNMSEALEAYRHVKQLSQMSVEVEEFVEQRIRYLAEVK